MLVDKVFPRFDHDVPDTKSNKQRFKEFIQVELSSDIKNIYCFADNLGIDSDYMFAFNCNPETSQKIIDKHNLKLDTINTDNAFGIQHDFPWWDKDKIKELDKYSWTNGNEYYQYYWYDEDNQQAYYFDFDM
ncbi:MAG: hypothetical protein C0596_01205 [Marinilabiliales bacterium]|nr:MAG: hypothetical protein C0596_01205 [Marinilabiliales bacterium]